MPNFILELEVGFSQKLLQEYKLDSKYISGTPSTLEKKLNMANVIRNTAKGEALKRLHKLQHDREYQTLQTEYATRKKVDPEDKCKDLSLRYAECYERVGYSEYALHQYILKLKYHFKNQLGADECQKLATQAFKAVDKIRTGESQKVQFIKRDADCSVEGKSNKSTLKYIGDACIQFGKGYVYPLIIKKNDTYATEALKHEVKYIRLIRRTIRGKRRYFVQLILDGIPPKTKNLKYGRKNSRVGLDEGVSTIAVVSKSEISLNELAPGTAVDEKKIRRLSRAIERSMRTLNPNNYNANGTIKKGYLEWVKSNRCQKLEAKRKELYRKSAWNRHCSHNALANHILSLGLDIRVEQMRISALSKRASKTTKTKSGKIHTKKRYGKTVLNRTPATLIASINRKLNYIGLEIQKVNTYHVKASQYDHKADCYKKKPLSARWHTFSDGTKVQRDLYSAFLIANTNDTLDQVDRIACIRNFKIFQKLHDEEIIHLRTQNTKALRWYIA